MKTNTITGLATMLTSLGSIVCVAWWIFTHSNEIGEVHELYEKRREIVHSIELMNEVHELQSKVYELQSINDSLLIKIHVLTEGKWPYDSLTILNRRGEWRTYPKGTNWIWKIRSHEDN